MASNWTLQAARVFFVVVLAVTLLSLTTIACGFLPPRVLQSYGLDIQRAYVTAIFSALLLALVGYALILASLWFKTDPPNTLLNATLFALLLFAFLLFIPIVAAIMQN